jgi:hypothetical protein
MVAGRIHTLGVIAATLAIVPPLSAQQSGPGPTPGGVQEQSSLESLFSPVALVFGSTAEFAGFGQMNDPPAPVRALRGLREWGLSPSVQSIGPRSGLGLTLELDRFNPLFVETGFSIVGSQRHSVGIALGDRRLGARMAYTFRRDAQDTFWGIGGVSRAEQRSDFLRDKSELQAIAWLPLSRVIGLSGGVSFEDNRVSNGRDDDLTDIHSAFEPDALYGLDERIRFLRFNLGTTFDFTQQNGFQRRGVWLQAGSALFRGVRGTQSNFHRFHGEFRGYLPLGSRQILALRGLLEVNQLDSGAGIPFYDLSRLGGSRNGPRGFAGGRFRDRTGATLMAEWRYELWQNAEQTKRLQVFFLFDEGGVAQSLSRISSTDFRESYGLGLRLMTHEGFAMMGYVAFSEEGTQLALRTQWPF